MQTSLPEGTTLNVSVDNALPIEAALREVLIAVAFALTSVLAVIYLFLGNLRATLIPAVTIPVSIIASLTVMYALGYSINVLTLLGLVLAIGLVVDDAIVVLENVHRAHELGEPPLVAAITGTREIGFAVIATTLTLISVFVPISFLPGDLGRLFREFGFTLAAAVAFSALDRADADADAGVAPAGARAPQPLRGRDGPLLQAARELLRALPARRASRRPWTVVGVLAVLDRRRRRDVPLGAGRVHAAGRQRPRVHRASKAPRARASSTSTATRASSKRSRSRRSKAATSSACSSACRAKAATTCAPATSTRRARF